MALVHMPISLPDSAMKDMLGSLKSRWQGLVRVADLLPGRVLVRRVRGRLVGVADVGDNIYVFDGSCPHAGQSLRDAAVSDRGVVVCPKHGLKLALEELPCRADAMPVAQLPFRVRDGVIEVDRGALR
jgi:nitrite reductase/ring-hydroxylating ferredoxin subunit